MPGRREPGRADTAPLLCLPLPAELPFVFHASTNPHLLAQNITFTPAELQLEQNFVDYWANFIMHGNPNAGASPRVPVRAVGPPVFPGVRAALILAVACPAGLSCHTLTLRLAQPVGGAAGHAPWPMWNTTSRESILLQTPAPSVDASAMLCTFWDSVGYAY